MPLTCRRHRPNARFAWACAWLAGAAPALAAPTCGVLATPLVFGPYDTLLNQVVQVNATVTVSCIQLIGTIHAIPYTVSLGPSATSGSMARALGGPMGARLHYTLYTSAARSTVWGDGTGGTATVPGSITPGALGIAVAQAHTVYGSIPALQTVRAGLYSDSILVTVDY